MVDAVRIVGTRGDGLKTLLGVDSGRGSHRQCLRRTSQKSKEEVESYARSSQHYVTP